MKRSPFFAAMLAATATLASVYLSGCSGTYSPQGDSRRAALAAARARWAGVNQNSYGYQLTIGCFCSVEVRGPHIVNVVNGVPRTGTESAAENYDTMAELFAVIEDAIDRDADLLTVEYSSTDGHPVEVFIDYNENIADEELGLTIADFYVGEAT